MAFGPAKLLDVSGGWQGTKRLYTMKLRVLGDNAAVDGYNPIGAMTASGVPKVWRDCFDPGNGGTIDDRAICVSKTFSKPAPLAKWALYHITCNFETLTREQQKRTQHPLDRPAEITDGAGVYAVAKHLDINRRPILNGAKQLFNPPCQFDEARGTITVTRNLPARLDKRAWINRVNSDAFDIYDPGELKIQDIQQVRRIEEFDLNGDGNPDEVEYWEVSVVIEELPISDENPNGWQPSFLNAGRKQLSGGIIDRSDIRDPSWPLTAAGAFIDEADLPDDANYIDVEAYRTAAYSGMGLFA